MKSRLVIIRNPESSLFGELNLSREGQKVVLTQNGLFSPNIDKNNCFFLENEAITGNTISGKAISYDALLDAIIDADQLVTI